MIIYCPKHKNERLHQLFISVSEQSVKKLKTMKSLEYMFCEKCNKPYKPKVKFD